MKKVLVLGKVHNSGLEFLKKKSYEILELSDQNDDYKKALHTIDALILKMTNVDNEFLKLASNLKVIARHGVGYNNVDLKSLNKKKIPLFITGDVNSDSVSEHTIGLILSIAKKINIYDQEIRNNNFNIRNSFKSVDLNEKKILIFGYGRIGKKVATICRFFNMQVYVYDKFIDNSEINKEFIAVNDLNENLEIYDYISLHIPFNNSDKPLIDKTFLNRLKKNCTLINTSRGDLINQKDLKMHLSNNPDFYAGLDVFNPEPPDLNDEIFKYKNLVMTPHSAAYTEECLKKMSLFCGENIDNFFNNNFNKDLLINKEILN